MERGFWEKPLIQIFDPLGNCCPGLFCTNEHLWKIEAGFFRTRGSQFRPEETWLITNVAIPRNDGINLLRTTNTLQGARVAVVDLRGSLYAEPFRPNKPQIAADGLILSVVTSQEHAPVKVLIRARDHAGRDLITRASDLFPTTLRQVFGEVQQQFEIQPLPDSQSLHIELIVQKPVRFEFFVESKSHTQSAK